MEAKSSFRNFTPLRQAIRWSVNGRLYFRSFLSPRNFYGALNVEKESDRKKNSSTRYGRGTAMAKGKERMRGTVEEERGSNRVGGSLVNARENWLLNLAAGMSSAPPVAWLTPFPSNSRCLLTILSLGSGERWRE